MGGGGILPPLLMRRTMFDVASRSDAVSRFQDAAEAAGCSLPPRSG